jgi:hypothetical protein
LPRCSKKNRHTPRKRSIQYAAPPRFHHWRLGILDRPLEPVIGRPFGRPVGGRCKFRSCPGRGAAFFTLLRRAGTHSDSSRVDPGSAAHRCALRCVRGTLWAPLEVCQTCLMKECGGSTFRSCPGRGAAPFALLRRAGTHSDGSTVDPGSAAHRCALRCVRETLWATAGGLSDVSDEGNAERPHFARVPDAVQRPSRCCAEPGPIVTVARWTPARQRTAARCAASGERCGTAGGLSDVFDEGMRREQIPLVSRTQCNVLHVAPRAGTQIDSSTMDPGSAAHHCALRCVRGTLWHRRRFVRRV